MRSTSCKEIARKLLDECLAGHPPKTFPGALVQDPCGQALFGTLVEGLADRFEPALCDAYARLFSQAVAQAVEGLDAAALVARYDRVRRVRPVAGRPRRVFILSRVTLGADVAVTSVMLAAAKKRFPQASIVFVGPRKNFELFAADRRIHHAEVAYRRGSLRERLAAWEELKGALTATDSAVIDPDSRLTQLGLLPVCSEDHYHLFESRGYGGESDRPLPDLAADWVEKTLGIAGAKPYVAPGPAPSQAPYVAVSLGVGENPAKRLPDPFEEELLRLLAGRGMPLYIDRGAGGEEAERVKRAVDRSGAKVTFWDGSFAGFAAIVTGAKLYVGYDSAGQHVAAAAGVPLIGIFAGFPAPRMFERWRPTGPHCTVIRVDRPDVEETLARVQSAMGNQVVQGRNS
ncbi:MAG: glycosyltransferase family 9 protein [Candidatus Sulfopaludibacter sp.]|nr:glycosyltransferase family 9 protein [Candidatus Sulfopaludibacter sp.]